MKKSLRIMLSAFAVSALALIMMLPITFGGGSSISTQAAASPAAISTYNTKGKVVTPTASVEKQSGNKNLLTVTVTETYPSIDWNVVSTEKFSIDNNAAGTYKVGSYNVYVDTKGNTQIRDCYIASSIPTTLSTFEKLNDAGMYSMEYLEDYKFDQFLQTGAANDDELAEYLQNVLLEGLPVEIKPPQYGCSTFSGELAESGDRIFARNFDNSFTPSLVVKTSPKNGYKSISTVNLTFVGYTSTSLLDLNDEATLLKTLVAPYVPLDGVNEKGLSIGVLQLNWLAAKQSDPNKVNLPTTTMIRMVLDKAATVDEAIELMGQYNMRDSLGPNFHYQIADRSGKSVVVEYFNDELRVIEQNPDENFHLATNFYLSPEAMSIPAQLARTVRPDYNCPRYYKMKEVLSANGGVFANEQEAMDLLQAVHQTSSTWWSVVYNLEKLTVMFVPARQYSEPAYYFAL